MTGKLAYGPPTYDFEIWLASALLSTTFPFLMFYAAFFGARVCARSPRNVQT